MFHVNVAPQPLNLALWLFLGALVHDLLLLPLYSGADALIRRLPAPLINHVRFPVAISAVLLLVWFPLILQRQPSGYVNALGCATAGLPRPLAGGDGRPLRALGARVRGAPAHGVTSWSTPSVRPVTTAWPVEVSTATESGCWTVACRATT